MIGFPWHIRKFSIHRAIRVLLHCASVEPWIVVVEPVAIVLGLLTLLLNVGCEFRVERIEDVGFVLMILPLDLNVLLLVVAHNDAHLLSKSVVDAPSELVHREERHSQVHLVLLQGCAHFLRIHKEFVIRIEPRWEQDVVNGDPCCSDVRYLRDDEVFISLLVSHVLSLLQMESQAPIGQHRRLSDHLVI